AGAREPRAADHRVHRCGHRTQFRRQRGLRDQPGARPRAARRRGHRPGPRGRRAGPDREGAMMADYVGAVDQGTTSSRFIVFDRDGKIVTVDQREHEQITPRAGWVEHDPKEIWTRTREVIGGALANSKLEAGDIAAIGITNQRETTVVWDRESG